VFEKYMFIWRGLVAIVLAAGTESKIAKAMIFVIPPLIAVLFGVALGIEPQIQPGKFFGLFAGSAVAVSAIAYALQSRNTNGGRPKEDQDNTEEDEPTSV